MSPGRGGCAFSFHALFLGRAREVSARPQRPRRLGPSTKVPDVLDRAGHDPVTACQAVGHSAPSACALFARQKDGDRLLRCEDARCARHRRGPRRFASRQKAHIGVRRTCIAGLLLFLDARARVLTRQRLQPGRLRRARAAPGARRRRPQPSVLLLLDRAGCRNNVPRGLRERVLRCSACRWGCVWGCLYICCTANKKADFIRFYYTTVAQPKVRCIFSKGLDSRIT